MRSRWQQGRPASEFKHAGSVNAVAGGYGPPRRYLANHHVAGQTAGRLQKPVVG